MPGEKQKTHSGFGLRFSHWVLEGFAPAPRRLAVTASQPDEEVLFNAARQIGDRAARAQYLREAAGGDEGLLRRVEALLAVHDAPDRLLDRPALARGETEACGPAAE